MAEETDLHDIPLETPEAEEPELKLPVSNAPESGRENPELKLNANVQKEQDVAESPEIRTHINGIENPAAGVPDAVTTPAKRSLVVDRVLSHSKESFRQFTYLEMLMADDKETIADRDVVDSVLNIVC